MSENIGRTLSGDENLIKASWDEMQLQSVDWNLMSKELPPLRKISDYIKEPTNYLRFRYIS